MKTILDDPEGFFENGGWSFLDTNSDNEDQNGEGETSDEDEVYEVGNRNLHSCRMFLYYFYSTYRRIILF
jgi:hypothetical protein